MQPGAQSIQAAITAALDLSGFGASGAAAADLFALPAASRDSGRSGSADARPPPYAQLPADAAAALTGALPTWREAGASRRRLAAAPLPDDAYKVGVYMGCQLLHTAGWLQEPFCKTTVAKDGGHAMSCGRR
jgi:hypothetical protein